MAEEECREPELYVDIIRNRLGVVDNLVFTQHIEPDLEKLGIEVRYDAEKRSIKMPTKAFRKLSIATIETLSEWEGQGKLYATIICRKSEL